MKISFHSVRAHKICIFLCLVVLYIRNIFEDDGGKAMLLTAFFISPLSFLVHPPGSFVPKFISDLDMSIEWAVFMSPFIILTGYYVWFRVPYGVLYPLLFSSFFFYFLLHITS